MSDDREIYIDLPSERTIEALICSAFTKYQLLICSRNCLLQFTLVSNLNKCSNFSNAQFTSRSFHSFRNFIRMLSENNMVILVSAFKLDERVDVIQFEPVTAFATFRNILVQPHP